MSTRRKVLLIALVWAAVAVLCALPVVWPACGHLVKTRAFQGYELEANGILVGWVTRDILGRRRRRRLG